MTSLRMRQMYQNGTSASSAPAADSAHERQVRIRYVPAYSSSRDKWDCFFKVFTFLVISIWENLPP